MAWVQGPTAASAAGASSISKAFASSTPAGNLVVVVVAQLANPTMRAITNVRDDIDAGVDYTLAKSIANGTTTQIDIYYKVASSAGTRTVTCSFTGGTTDSSIAINEYDSTYTGLGPTSSATGTANSIAPTAVDAGTTGQYIYALTDENGPGLTPEATFNTRQQIDSSAIAPICVGDLVTSGSKNPTTTGTTPGRWSCAAVTFVPGAPTITAQPQDARVWEGQTANFTVSATASAGSLHYQWKDDGSNVGSDSNSYTTGALAVSDSGSLITCDVSDDNGTTTTRSAVLTVLHAGRPYYLRA